MRLAEQIKNSNDGLYLISTGQAGFIIKSKNGKMLAIDLYLSDYVERLEGNIGFKRLLPKLLDPNELIFDIVIATHPHGDHYDKDTMIALMNNSNTVLFASEECKEIVEKQGIDPSRVGYRSTGYSDDISGFKIDFVDCDHGDGAPDAFGLVVHVDGITIYEVGDSCYHKDYALNIAEKYKTIDVLIGPINGAYGNMNEEEFANYTEIIKPKLAIPCHYGMFAAHGGNIGKYYKIMTEHYPHQKIALMQQGEILKL